MELLPRAVRKWVQYWKDSPRESPLVSPPASAGCPTVGEEFDKSLRLIHDRTANYAKIPVNCALRVQLGLN